MPDVPRRSAVTHLLRSPGVVARRTLLLRKPLRDPDKATRRHRPTPSTKIVPQRALRVDAIKNVLLLHVRFACDESWMRAD